MLRAWRFPESIDDDKPIKKERVIKLETKVEGRKMLQVTQKRESSQKAPIYSRKNVNYYMEVFFTYETLSSLLLFSIR